MVNYSVVIWSLETNHLTEFGAFACGQSLSFFCRQGLGVLIVLISAFDHFQRHGGVGRVVLVEVQYPLQTSCKVLSVTICHLFAVHVNPFNAVSDFKGPGQTAILGTPFLCDCRSQFTFMVSFQKTINQVGQVFKVLCSLAVQPVESFELTACKNTENRISDFICTCFSRSVAALIARATIGAAAAGQNQNSSQSQCEQFRYCLFHKLPPCYLLLRTIKYLSALLFF